MASSARPNPGLDTATARLQMPWMAAICLVPASHASAKVCNSFRQRLMFVRLFLPHSPSGVGLILPSLLDRQILFSKSVQTVVRTFRVDARPLHLAGGRTPCCLHPVFITASRSAVPVCI